MSVIVFGENRRQKPLELRCPGGKIVISRAPHGTVRVELQAEAGAIEVVSERDFSTVVELVHESDEAQP